MTQAPHPAEGPTATESQAPPAWCTNCGAPTKFGHCTASRRWPDECDADVRGNTSSDAHRRTHDEEAGAILDEIFDDEEVEQGVVDDGIPILALAPDILAMFEEAIRRSGVVGEERIAKTEYLSLTSRLDARPTSLVVKGASSSGKSFTTERTVEFFPPEAVIVFTGMSEKALLFSEASFEHRTIIIYEASALRERAERQSGDMTAYYVRSLISEGEAHYEMTIKTKDGGWTTKRFEKKGPTNVIVTTTAINLHNENETRMLSLHTDDSRKQTAAILRSMTGEPPEPLAMEPWHELQQWLAEQNNEVIIPFGRFLADNMPPAAVRLRRDFGSLLSLVRAHAILHQATRRRDKQGRIVATWADYAAVRALIVDVVSEGVGASVSDTIRETVNAVGDLVATHSEGVPAAEVGRKLGLDRSAARRRLTAALEKGYVVNQEERRGKPGRYVLGEPLPDDLVILPEVPDTHTPSEPTATLPPPGGGLPPDHREPQETAGQGGGGTVARGSEGVATHRDCVRCARYGPNHRDDHLGKWA
jgi:hypothetical protein